MREFKKGDKVKIPSEPDIHWSFWLEEMNEYCGSMQIVSSICDDRDARLEGCIATEDNYFFSPSYLLTEPYNQSEQEMEIDDRNKLSEEQIEILKELRFDTLEISFVEGQIMGALAGTDFETSKPKTRPLTHFEIFKMDAVFKQNWSTNIGNTWNSSFSVEDYEYCLKSDFNKAQSIEDVVWKPLTTEEP